MAVVYVINERNRHHYRDVIDRYYSLRHQVFVGERGWRALASREGREIDAYDNAEAVYLLALDGERIIGGLRLGPTTQPHLLSEVFSHLASFEGVLQGADIYECTRFFVARDDRSGRTNCTLLAAMQEFCLSQNINHVTAVVETRWFARLRRAGFEFRPLGAPVLIEGLPCVAIAADISEASLATARRLAGLKGSVLVRHEHRNLREQSVCAGAASYQLSHAS
ncbi:acyl-homoserine-lactone synthase [Chelativorans salis]|uniref:Acyl-homoserine-lactone synthase n=1 Tax=Chelativorans salis TaxID=2978478 RepID=A0ABT2LVS3_9HYPH|nr:acyl-homoserine-lactone synthase [Chelativorans sp. EGI FJ00035]MCT7377967.1 GNAT family N-acetyltransferase [Chelativorans sp. EGI FJ00035]